MSKRQTGLLKSSQDRTDSVRQNAKKAMKIIEAEIEKNDGIYPFNSGRLSQAEFCRRAKFHQVTLLGDNHKGTTKKAIDKWLETINKSLIVGSKVVRKAITERADNSEQKYKDAATQMHLYELAAISTDKTIQGLRSRVEELEREIAALRKEASGGKVIPIFRR